MKVAITGGTGFIGTEITKKLIELGDEVLILDRNPPQVKASFIKIDLKSPIDKNLFDGIDAVINLTGVNIFGRWNKKLKKEIYESRIITTRNIIKTLNSLDKKPSVFISASAVGFYGNKDEEEVDENSKPGDDFLAKVCIDWENEVKKINPSIRWVILRTAPVLDKNRGFLTKSIPFFKLKINVIMGSGKQWFPWIHIEDIVGIYIYSIKNENTSGIYNAVAPEKVKYEEFTNTLADIFKTKINLRLPSFILKLALGELSQVVLASQKVSSQKILDAGYKFKFPNIKEALYNIFRE